MKPFTESGASDIMPARKTVASSTPSSSRILAAMIAAGQEDFGSEWRQNDLDYLMSKEFRDHLEKYSIIPITWREMYESFVSQKMSY